MQTTPWSHTAHPSVPAAVEARVVAKGGLRRAAHQLGIVRAGQQMRWIVGIYGDRGLVVRQHRAVAVGHRIGSERGG